MEPTIEVQKLFFQHIRNNLPAHLSFVEEISGQLNISNDSAYRRIRGEKPINFDELRALCLHFKVSLDQLFHLGTNSIIFEGKPVDGIEMSMESYLNYILSQLQMINSFPGKGMISMHKDLPIFQYFVFPELAAFKFFFWMKTILNFQPFHRRQYLADEHLEHLHAISHCIIEEFNKIPTQEIWNIECVHSSIRQIEYYKDSKIFASGRDIVDLYDALSHTLDHIEAQAEQEHKFVFGEKSTQHKAPYKVYVNEFVLGDNAYVALLNNAPYIVFLNHSVLNVISTRDTYFTGHTYEHFQNMIRKSSLISGAGERDRRKFFNTMREKIENRRRAAENY